jgi:adenylate cyclase class 2
MSWLEVETKIRLDESKINELRKKIKKIAKFKEKIKKTDEYYAINVNGYPKKAFRIRKKGSIYEVNFKKKRKNLSSKEIITKEEFEFKLTDLDSFVRLMLDLGFSKWIKKEKISETYLYIKNKKLSIELNNVKNLGYFIELEYLCQKQELKIAKKTIIEAIKKLEIPFSKIDNTGYTKMLFEKRDLKY